MMNINATNWPDDIYHMHDHYGFHDAIKKLDSEKLRAYLKFRAKFIREELDELDKAIEEGNAEEIVDALIDIPVVAIGTLDVFGVDVQQAWKKVLRANMEKEVGIKASRPNKFNLPDLIKPESWLPPSHIGNHGMLSKIFEN